MFRYVLILLALPLFGCPAPAGDVDQNLDPNEAVQGIEAGNPGIGIEAGNPIIGKAIRVIPESSIYAYVVSIDTPERGTVAQYGTVGAFLATKALMLPDPTATSSLLETRAVTFIKDTNGTIHLVTLFTNGQEILVTVTVQPDGSVTALNTRINSSPVESTFEVQATTTCRTESSNAATQLAEAICSKITGCIGDQTCNTCRAVVLADTELAGALGITDGTPVWQAVEDGVLTGLYSVSPIAHPACLAEIDVLTCQAVGEVILATGKVHYDGISAIISADGACPDVF